ncbi:energy transducer TonB [Microbacter margulisiae]|uniref:Protein TonB n=1 Tax=Microbacter margulisiae TaxID=1350067 RepID=A0A7W5DN98_9PORP|nr:energy transducer TonB [Microbacter margulisiae]MBB3185896.1 protein TonB [Microbacter margulisiae]
MTNEKQYIESLEEMVFKNRNKAYGSYQLRKKYKKYILIALASALFLFAVIIAYPLIKSILEQGNAGRQTQTETTVELINPNNTPPPPPPPPPPKKLIEKVKFVAPKVTTDTTQVSKDFGKQSKLNETVNQLPPPPVVKKQEVIETPKQDNQIFMIVEQMPQFPNGDINAYLSSHIKYPVVAQENGIQGRVIVQFVVNQDGSIVDVTVVRGVDPSLDKEAVRVIEGMPKWIPGKQGGKPVRVKFTLPVNFKLQ